MINSEIRLPAEWEPQQAMLICWPHQHSAWAEQLTAIEELYIQLATHISHYQSLYIISVSTTHSTYINKLLTAAKANCNDIHYLPIPTNDTWLRDNGPICCVQNSELICYDFVFNGWGNKYPHELDNQVTTKLHQQYGIPKSRYQQLPIILEGGAIDTNGHGALLTTSSCLLNPNRNPTMACQAYNELFANYFGIDEVLWLNDGYLAGDDTDGHIDMLARFYNENSICYISCSDPKDEHYQSLQAFEQNLLALSTGKKHYNCTPLPLPPAIYGNNGQRLPASYANFIILNNAVLVPTYQAVSDVQALDIIAQCFPKHTIIPLDARVLISQGGSLHCATRHIPL